ncbi:MAG: hypothetical protein ACP5H8_00850 [Candidatus Micrarchaeia archaeon]
MGCGIEIVSAVWLNVFLALLIVFMLATLLYMLGNFLKKEEYIAMAKTEYYNFIVTFALVFSFTAIVGIANELSCPNDQPDLFTQAIEKINNIMYSEIYPMLRTLFQIMFEASGLSNTTILYDKGDIKFTPMAGLKYFHTSLNVVSFILESVFASLYIQSFLLAILKETAFSILVPVGIFLRAFPITRDAGTILMSLSFSLYTIYPYLYVFSLDVYASEIRPYFTYSELSRSIYSYGLIGDFATKVESVLFYALTFATYSSIKEMFYDIGAHLFIAVIIPSLAIILTVAMTQSIYKFIKEVTV